MIIDLCHPVHVPSLSPQNLEQARHRRRPNIFTGRNDDISSVARLADWLIKLPNVEWLNPREELCLPEPRMQNGKSI